VGFFTRPEVDAMSRTLDLLHRFFRALREIWIGLMMPTTST